MECPEPPKGDRAPRPRLRSVGSDRPPFPTSWQRPRANSSGWWRARRLAAVARETEGPGATASEPVVARVAKRDRAFKEDHLRGAVAAAKGRAKREKKVVQSAAQPRQGRDKDLEPDVRDACAGIATQATLHSITLSILSSSPSSSTEFNGMLLKHTSRFHQGGGWRSPAGRSKINFHVAVSAAPAPLGCTSQPKWPRGTVVRAPLCRSLLVSWEHCPAGQ